VVFCGATDSMIPQSRYICQHLFKSFLSTPHLYLIMYITKPCRQPSTGLYQI